MNINFNKIITILLPFMILFTIAFIISNYLYMQLPKTSKEFIESEVSPLSYYKYNVQKSFNIIEKTVVSKKVVPIKREYLLNENIKLHAIYHFGKDDGLAVISENANSKTHTLGKNDQFKKYILKAIYPNYVLFSKDNKNYKLEINNKKVSKNILHTNAKRTKKRIEEKPVIVQDGNNFELEREDILTYSKDLKKIWNDIGIRTYKKNGKAIGFIVNKIKQKSIFTEIGLKKGDILIKANNIDLTNYQNAFKIYHQIEKIDALKLVILRNNNQMELEYEIK